ncbi:MAG: hypothetical protein JXA99_14950 [Candidatus Lokiarchaeota archaeon]|nr:hypothetical protein [Candidatus Lokiarchaeota archaeon]
MIKIHNLELHNSKVRELKYEIEEKNRQLYNCADRIEILEDNILELEDILNNKINHHLYKKLVDTKVNILVKEKELKIKELKHSLSFLRKELFILKRKYENGENRINEKGSIPNNKIDLLESLVQDLQYKISKNNIRLQHFDEEKKQLNTLLQIKKDLLTTIESKNEDLLLKLDEKNKEINTLKNTITQLELMFLEARKNSQID